MSSTLKARQLLKTRQRIPPVLPPGLPYLLSALGDDDISFAAMAEAVARFPSIAGRLLVIANSAWAAPATRISSLRDACARLGFTTVRSVSIALAVARPFNPGRCAGFNPEHYWFTAFLAADCAARLAPHLGGSGDAETLRTAGLLHNLGLLWLADVEPAKTDLALQTPGVDAQLDAALREIVGIDYCEAGEMLGEAWGLPEVFTGAMRHHRNPGYRGPHWQVAAGCGIAASVGRVLWRGGDYELAKTDTYLADSPLSMNETLFREMTIRGESIRELAQSLFGSLMRN